MSDLFHVVHTTVYDRYVVRAQYGIHNVSSHVIQDMLLQKSYKFTFPNSKELISLIPPPRKVFSYSIHYSALLL